MDQSAIGYLLLPINDP